MIWTSVSLIGFFISILGAASGKIDDYPRESDVLSNVVQKILNLLREEVQRKSIDAVIPVENLKWQGPQNLGQISGVSVDLDGNPVIFHRGDRSWNFESFDEMNVFSEIHLGPIHQDTVLILNGQNGVINNSWGADTFYLPHGIHIDPQGNIWLTDVALHQVFKFERGSKRANLVLGEAFIPGSDNQHFCQPTTVATTKSGQVVVADGYCNSRLLIFDQDGNFLSKIPRVEEFVSLRVPHGLAVLDDGQVCIADRENMRIICLSLVESLEANNDDDDEGMEVEVDERRPPLTLTSPDLGRVFAIAAHGNTLYAVNGPTSPIIPLRGFTIDPNNRIVLGHWTPATGTFSQPHAMAIAPNNSTLYVTEIGPNRIWKFDLVKYIPTSQSLW